MIDIEQSAVFAFVVVRLLVAVTLTTDSDKTAAPKVDFGKLVD